MLACAETKGWVEGLRDENSLDKKKMKAKSYLAISQINKAFKFLYRLKNPKDIWEPLEEEFVPTKEDDRYELEQEFKRCTMEDDYSKPTDWFNRIDEINTKLSNINSGKYIKSEMISNCRLG